MLNIRKWLEDIGLPMYAAGFEAARLEVEDLARLSDAELTALKVLPTHRERLRRAAKALEGPAGAPERFSGEAPGNAPGQAERRQVTLMFSDLVGSTSLAHALDPEDVREIFRTYQEIVTLSVEEFEGSVANLIGDGVLAAFGHPVSHEDDPSRAVSAGLLILERVAAINPVLKRRFGAEIGVRVGIHTGTVVIGDIGSPVVSQGSQIIGPAPNVVARLQAAADPGTLVVSETTLRLLHARFQTVGIGKWELKGLDAPITVHRVVGARPASEGHLPLRESTSSALVGRERHLAALERIWSEVRSGSGRVVVLEGEAGIGKSRLIGAFREVLPAGGHERYTLYCSPQHENSALWPVIQHLKRAFDIKGDDDPDRAEKIRAYLDRAGLPREAFEPYLAALLSVRTAEAAALGTLTSKQLKQRTYEALLSMLKAAARKAPVLVVVEDVHWADASTKELADALVAASTGLPIMALVSVRVPPGSPWSKDDAVDVLRLEALEVPDAMRLAREVAHPTELPQAVARAIVDKAGGNPLFVEELTKGFVGGEETASGAVPLSLRDALTARLDRLGLAKSVAQFCALLGRRFRQDVLVQASPFEKAELLRGVEDLLAAQVLRAQSSSDGVLYAFNHVLLQEAAAETLLKSRRRVLHAHIAGVFEAAYPSVAEAEPEVIAHHLTEAGETARALSYWEKAAKRALDRSANAEAASLLRTALQLIADEPPAPARDQKELMLSLWLGTALTAMRSYADDEVGRNYRRAGELCTAMGDLPPLFPVISGLYRYYFVRGELETALHYARHMLSIAGQTGDTTMLVEGNRSVGLCLGYQGKLAEGLSHVATSIARFDPHADPDHLIKYGTDALVSSLTVRATLLLLQGYTQRAMTDVRRALARADEVAHPFTQAWALSYAGTIDEMVGDYEACRAHAEACCEVALKHDFPFWYASGTMKRGAAMFFTGEDESEGIRLMSDGLKAWRATGAEIYRPFFVTMLARAYDRIGMHEAAVRLMDDSLTEQATRTENWFRAETLRLRAEFAYNASGGQINADPLGDWRASLIKAVETAREQGALMLELRARLTLMRLSGGNDEAAGDMQALSGLYATLGRRSGASDHDAATQALS